MVCRRGTNPSDKELCQGTIWVSIIGSNFEVFDSWMILADHVDVVVAPLAIRSTWPVIGVDHFHVPHFSSALYPFEHGFGMVGVASPGTVTLAVARTTPAAHERVECDYEFCVGFALFWCAIVFNFHC